MPLAFEQILVHLFLLFVLNLINKILFKPKNIFAENIGGGVHLKAAAHPATPVPMSILSILLTTASSVNLHGITNSNIFYNNLRIKLSPLK